jgi:uncharacterized membrane protein
LSYLVELFPALLIGWIYAVIVFIVARKRRINPWGWTIGTLVPAFGVIVGAVFMLMSFLSVFDRLNALEGRTERPE